MKQQTQVALVRRILDHVASKTTDTADEPSTLPVAAYVDAARLARENEVLFRKLPLIVGHTRMLPNPGDFITHDLSGLPLLVVRKDDGSLAAHLNVCRHRGTRVEPARCGSKKAFSCPYHAWTYARDGRLLTIPHERGFAGIDKTERGLASVPVREEAGLIWIRPTPGWLEDLADDLVGFGIDSAYVYDERHFEKELSWKLALDVFLEAYHLKTTHRETIYPLFFDNLGLVEPHGPHLRNVFPKRTVRDLPSHPEETWRLREHANVLYHLFPNTLVLVQPDHAAVVHVWPDGPMRSKLHTYTLIPEPATTEKARKYWDANNAILYGATDEDFVNGESIQRGLTSGANREVVFGAFEHGLAHFHREIERRTAP